MANHVNEVMKARATIGDEQLVERIAHLEPLANGKARNHFSFASKLCHIFVSEDTFPIYDGLARETLRLHNKDVESPYQAFRSNFRMLSEYAGIRIGVRRLDRYLWLVGLYERWRNKKPVNGYFSRMLRNPTSDQKSYLAELLPECIERRF
jgi:hypothetical protein